MHACFFLPSPPNFRLSLHVGHFPQSFRMHQKHFPHRRSRTCLPEPLRRFRSCGVALSCSNRLASRTTPLVSAAVMGAQPVAQSRTTNH